MSVASELYHSQAKAKANSSLVVDVNRTDAFTDAPKLLQKHKHQLKKMEETQCWRLVCDVHVIRAK